MKANSTKRKIFDAVDLLTEDTSSQMPVKTIAAKSVVVTERACVVRSELRIMITQEHLGRRKQ